MVSVEVSDNDIRRIVSSGHAEYAKSGEDIVCAAVSVLMQAAVNGIVLVLGQDEAKKYYKIVSEDKLQVEFPHIDDEIKEAQMKLLFDNTCVNLEALTLLYEKNIHFVKKEGKNDNNRFTIFRQ